MAEAIQFAATPERARRVNVPLLKPAVWDAPINYQRLRHGGAARRLRGMIYRRLVGRDGWPLVFRPPVGDGPC